MKGFFMKIKSREGYVGVDISIAIIILLFMIPTIMGIVYFVNSSRLSTQIKSEAINILVNTIETAKGINVEDIDEASIFNSISGYSVQDIEDNEAVIKTDTASYKLQINIQDFSGTNSGSEQKVVKTIIATVIYKIRNIEEKMDLKTVLK